MEILTGPKHSSHIIGRGSLENSYNPYFKTAVDVQDLVFVNSNTVELPNSGETPKPNCLLVVQKFNWAIKCYVNK